METTIGTKSTVIPLDREKFSVIKHCFSTTIRYAFLPAVNKSLHAVLMEICTRGRFNLCCHTNFCLCFVGQRCNIGGNNFRVALAVLGDF